MYMRKRKTMQVNIKVVAIIIALTLIITSKIGIIGMALDRSKIASPCITDTIEKIDKITSPTKNLSGYSRYSCLYFGSYPQTEIIPENVTYSAWNAKCINKEDYIADQELYSTLKNATDWDENGESIVNGEKYKRITDSFVTDGHCYYNWQWMKDEQVEDENEQVEDENYHYFKYEPIKWKVLCIDGNNVMLQSELVLDNQKFNETKATVVWENCTLRSWLNGYDASVNADGKDYSRENFIDSAFSPEERDALIATELENNTSTTKEKTRIADKVYLLSKADVSETDNGGSYGFDSDIDRQQLSSSYAKAKGVVIESDDNLASCFWWLRTVGTSENKAKSIGTEGAFYESAVTSDKGVCAVITLDLNHKNLFTLAGAKDNGKNERASVTYNTISLGSYPQAEVISSTTVPVIQKKYLEENLIEDDALYEQLKNTTNWDENNDVVINGEKYRKVEDIDIFYDMENDGWRDSRDSNCAYFKYQPIIWRVLQVKDGKALLLSDVALDAKKYASNWYKQDVKTFSWEASDLRSWLNGYGSDKNGSSTDFRNKNFINTAFSSLEQSAILETALDNEGIGENTSDKLFVLSKSQVSGEEAFEYFAKDEKVEDLLRCSKSSTYAKIMGLDQFSIGYEGNCYTWLRSYNESNKDMYTLQYDGTVSSLYVWLSETGVSMGGISPSDPDIGVRVAMTIDINSDLYSYIDTVTVIGKEDINKNNSDTSTVAPTAASNPTGISTSEPIKTPITDNSSVPQVTILPTIENPPTLQGTTVPPVGTPIPQTITNGTEITINNDTYVITDTAKKTASFSGLVKKTTKNVTIPATITYNGQIYKVTAIKENAFSQNKILKTVTIGKNITDIGAKAFYKCTKLAKITIPSKVSKIGKQTFYGCGKLKSITIKTTKLTTKNVGNKAFKGIAKKAVIKVPKSKKKAYQKMLKNKGIGNKVRIK